MKRMLSSFLVALAILVGIANNASAQQISGSVVEFETGNPLSSEAFPYVTMDLGKLVNGQLQPVASTDCRGGFNACAGSSGYFSINNAYMGKALEPGTYTLRVWSPFHRMEIREVELTPKGINVGDVVLRRQPVGAYVSNVQQTPDAMVVTIRAYRTTEGPAPALAARLNYNGPGVTTPWVNFEAGRQAIEWENEWSSKEMTFLLPIHAQVPSGSNFTGSIAIERADSGFHRYALLWFSGVKGIPDFIGW